MPDSTVGRSVARPFAYVRGVSGWGPRCGCGGKSELHVGFGQPREPGVFLCADCVTEAVLAFMRGRPDQMSYWPGDEGRDEHYTDPREA